MTDVPPVRVAEPASSVSQHQILRVIELGRIDYGRALALQESLIERKVGGDTSDHLLLLEHDPVYTLGRGADEADLMGAPQRLGVPVFRVGRGGGVTFHGPGQLVAYPILRLRRGGRDVHRYVRALEEILIDTCARYGIAASARPGTTGVWVADEKIASIGIGVRRWITFHGLALNVSTDLSYFEHVVPCRVPQLRVTCLSALVGREMTVEEVASELTGCFVRRMGYSHWLREEAP